MKVELKLKGTGAIQVGEKTIVGERDKWKIEVNGATGNPRINVTHTPTGIYGTGFLEDFVVNEEDSFEDVDALVDALCTLFYEPVEVEE